MSCSSASSSTTAHLIPAGTPSHDLSLKPPSFLLAFCFLRSPNCFCSHRRSSSFMKFVTSGERHSKGLTTKLSDSSSDSSDEINVIFNDSASLLFSSASFINLILFFNFCNKKWEKKWESAWIKMKIA